MKLVISPENLKVQKFWLAPVFASWLLLSHFHIFLCETVVVHSDLSFSFKGTSNIQDHFYGGYKPTKAVQSHADFCPSRFLPWTSNRVQSKQALNFTTAAKLAHAPELINFKEISNIWELFFGFKPVCIGKISRMRVKYIHQRLLENVGRGCCCCTWEVVLLTFLLL